MSKYGNRPTWMFGILFDSEREAWDYAQLYEKQENGEIRDLRLQVPFELQPAFRRNGKRERNIVYKADFVYTRVKDGKTVIRESKGVKTQVWNIKRKMLLYKYPDIELEVT